MSILTKKTRGNEYAYVIKRLKKEFKRDIRSLYESGVPYLDDLQWINFKEHFDPEKFSLEDLDYEDIMQ